MEEKRKFKEKLVKINFLTDDNDILMLEKCNEKMNINKKGKVLITDDEKKKYKQSPVKPKKDDIFFSRPGNEPVFENILILEKNNANFTNEYLKENIEKFITNLELVIKTPNTINNVVDLFNNVIHRIKISWSVAFRMSASEYLGFLQMYDIDYRSFVDINTETGINTFRIPLNYLLVCDYNTYKKEHEKLCIPIDLVYYYEMTINVLLDRFSVSDDYSDDNLIKELYVNVEYNKCVFKYNVTPNDLLTLKKSSDKKSKHRHRHLLNYGEPIKSFVTEPLYLKQCCVDPIKNIFKCNIRWKYNFFPNDYIVIRDINIDEIMSVSLIYKLKHYQEFNLELEYIKRDLDYSPNHTVYKIPKVNKDEDICDVVNSYYNNDFEYVSLVLKMKPGANVKVDGEFMYRHNLFTKILSGIWVCTVRPIVDD